MEMLFVIGGGILLILGFLGSFLPVLPGPILSYIGLILLYWTARIPADKTILIIAGVVMLVISILDYVIPAQGTKYFGGSKYGIWGTNIGLVVGLIAPIPLGVIIGPFAGAFIGEWVFNRSATRVALRSATGSFLGFLASTFIKMIYCIAVIGLYLQLVWKYYF